MTASCAPGATELDTSGSALAVDGSRCYCTCLARGRLVGGQPVFSWSPLAGVAKLHVRGNVEVRAD